MNFLTKKVPTLGRNLIFSASIAFKKPKYFRDLLSVRVKSTNASPRTFKGMFKLGLAGITVGALVGTGYSIHSKNKPRDHIINEENFIQMVNGIPEIKPSRRMKYAEDHSGLKLTLFQYQTCPFCCKVRAFLDYYGISYDVVEVDPVLRQSIKWSEYRKVPILVAQTENGYQVPISQKNLFWIEVGECSIIILGALGMVASQTAYRIGQKIENLYQNEVPLCQKIQQNVIKPLNDSTMIISALSTYLKDTDKSLPDIVKCFPFISFYSEDGSKKSEIMNRYFLMLSNRQYRDEDEKVLSEERKWRQWADNVLVHTLSPNVYRTREEALQAFTWFSEVGEWEKNFPSWERTLIIYVGASAMYLIGKRLKKRHHLKEDVRQSLYDECTKWVREVNSKGTPFLGGSQPNLADLSVYGILNSIEGCLAFKDLLVHTNINKWYSAMKEAVSQHQGAKFVK